MVTMYLHHTIIYHNIHAKILTKNNWWVAQYLCSSCAAMSKGCQTLVATCGKHPPDVATWRGTSAARRLATVALPPKVISGVTVHDLFIPRVTCYFAG